MKIERQVWWGGVSLAFTESGFGGLRKGLHTAVCSVSSHSPPPLPGPSSRGRKSFFFCVASNFVTQASATSMVRWTILLTFSSIRFIVVLVVFSISRRMPTLDEARGINMVLMQVINRCMTVKAERRLVRYERSGSVLALS